MSSRLQPGNFLIRALIVTLGLGSSCAKVSQTNDGTGGTGAVTGGGATGGKIGGGGGSLPPPSACSGKCTDFPTAAILDTGVSGDPSGSFNGNAPTSNGPCITEPEDGTLFPNNWLRPRVKFTNSAKKLAQIRMSAANQQNDLVAYTTSDAWVMPPEVWGGLRGHQTTDSVKITVWIQGMGASTSSFMTAPVGASGSLVFWAAQPSEVDKNLETECKKDPVTSQPDPACYGADSELRGFKVGDEGTVSVLKIPQIVQKSKDNNNKTSSVRCIGCHAGTPDGDFVAFNDAWPWRGVMAGVTSTNTGMVPPYLTVGGTETLWQPALGVMTFSKLHWSDTDRIAITSYSLKPPTQGDWFNAPKSPMPDLAWFDLSSAPVPLTGANIQGDPANPDRIFPVLGTNMGFIARNGDPRGGTTPNWGHTDADLIVYTSTNAALDGRLDNQPVPVPNPNNETHNQGHADIWTVPYNNKLGGTATPIAGADTTAFEEYFPSFSPDDRFVAFNRVPASQPMYANPSSEIAVIPAAGGTAHVLRANKPPACSGKTSPGVNNHWAKWSPEVKAGSDGTYYWLVFSSNRADIAPIQSQHGAKRLINISQLYVAPILVGELGITSFPAIYLWNQPNNTVNTTPAWEAFILPPVP